MHRLPQVQRCAWTLQHLSHVCYHANLDSNDLFIRPEIKKDNEKTPHLEHQSYIKQKYMNISDQIKNLIRNGKKDGYILKSELDKNISTFSIVDQNYIKNTIEGFKIQIVNAKSDYDELKYLSGQDAIDFLQNLSDGKYSAFEKDEE